MNHALEQANRMVLLDPNLYDILKKTNPQEKSSINDFLGPASVVGAALLGIYNNFTKN